MGITVLPPDVNRSGGRIHRGRGKYLLRPLGHQRLRRRGGRGHRGRTRRTAGRYRSLFDFCERLDSGHRQPRSGRIA